MKTKEIFKILASKPHNKHYLTRYINFIVSCTTANEKLHPETYFEKHHICPKNKSMFPEYKNLKIFIWNEAKLTFRQHILAHYILAKAYNTWECWESIKRTAGNPNAKITTKTLKSKTIELISTKTKKSKKGIFTRGYDENGNPKVKESTKILLSNLKKEYYSIPENKQKAKQLRSSDSYNEVNKISSARFTDLNKSRTNIPLSEDQKQNISTSNKEVFKDLSKRGKFIGLYVTPIGVGTSVHCLGGICKYSSMENKIVNNFMVSHSTIFTKTSVGKPLKELGFYFIHKNDPLFEQFRELLGLIHQPEPNHVLWSELNDYLLQKKLLP